MVSYKEILTKIRALEDIKKMQHEKPDPLSVSLQELKESLKGISDKDKEALGEYWDDLSINLELAVSQALHDADIIEEETMEDWLKKIRGEEPMRRDRKTRKGTSTSTQKTKDTAVTPEKEPLIKNN